MNEEKSTRYHRHRRQALIVGLGVRAVVAVTVLASDLSGMIRDGAGRSVAALGLDGGSAPLVAALAGLVLGVVVELFAFPPTWYVGHVLERRYGFSHAHGLTWLQGYARSRVVAGWVWMLVMAMVYGAMTRWPDGWWLAAAVALGLFTLIATYVAPAVVLPRFHALRPIRRPELRMRLEALTRRAGVPVIAIDEWTTGAGRARPNAALVGIGRTRRVLLSDTLLADYRDTEIEAIVAHELAHHVHWDIWRMLAVETAVGTVAFMVIHAAVVTIGPLLGLEGPADAAGVPLVALAGAGTFVLLAPLINGISRRQERRADRFALAITRDPDALVSGLRRLGAEHLAEERPSRIVEWLFHSHPPLAARLEAARAAVRQDFL